MNEPGVPSGHRETRLLALVIVVSVVVLLVLARFRFPAAELPATPAAGPLERLAARATFDELAGTVADLAQRVTPATVVVQVAVPDGTPAGLSYVPGLRVRTDAVLVHVPPGGRVIAVGGTAGPANVLASDSLHELALVQVPPVPEAVVPLEGAPMDLAGPRYVAAVEGGRGGAVVRPLFLDQTDRVDDARWTASLPIAGSQRDVPPGAFVFAFDGQLLGLAIDEGASVALVPAPALAQAVSALEHGPGVEPADPGFTWSALTPALSAATGVGAGVVVTSVDADAPAAKLLNPGDVIEQVGDEPVRLPSTLRVQLYDPKLRALSLRLRRGGQDQQVTVPLRTPAAAPDPSTQGATFQTVDREGARVRAVQSGAAAALAGLRPGDLITRAGATAAPTADEVGSMWKALPLGQWLIVVVDRGGAPLVLALHKP
jgi:serine protease Do